jgi:phosphoribosylformylglycinamidine synthase
VPAFEVHVEVRHLPGIADPAGATVARALPALGYENVREVHLGKSIRLVVESTDSASARSEVDDMCRRLLANPVIEAYDIEVTELSEPAPR